MSENNLEEQNEAIAVRWCEARGPDWQLVDTAGRGGTAPVFGVRSPFGILALKMYDLKFSEGELGNESERRLKPQLDLGLHNCPYLVRVHDGGRFEGRLFVLMDRAPGQELEKRLAEVPRDKIRGIVDQIARAAIFLRERGLCHRDIKSANIFVTEDFSHATLLDLSVLRDVNDPVGLGTDQGGQLPVVATSRYSPPEYLFRLLPPGEELWHALDIYQIGGLLHDLIMREPMFEAEYQKSRDNRYRFAWIVATQTPIVSAPDVDGDLTILARRALDKDWQHRSQMRLADFLNESVAQQALGLLALGGSMPGKSPIQPRTNVNRLMTSLAESVENLVSSSLRTMGITATHKNFSKSTNHRRIEFGWEPTASETVAFNEVIFSLDITRVKSAAGAEFAQTVELSVLINNFRKSVTMDLPSVKDDEDEQATKIANMATFSLTQIAAQMMRISDSGDI